MTQGILVVALYLDTWYMCHLFRLKLFVFPLPEVFYAWIR